MFALLQPGNVLLRADAGFLNRFRPIDASGESLKGPKTTYGGKSWNTGRQYFSSFKQGDMSSFFWADGVKGMEPEAQQDFNEYLGGMYYYYLGSMLY